MNGQLGAVVAVVVFLGVAAVLAVAYTVINRIGGRASAAPDGAETAHGTVIDRWEEDRSGGVVHGVTFTTDNGAQLELYLAGADLARLAVGDRGRVRHRGDRFGGFTPDPS